MQAQGRAKSHLQIISQGLINSQRKIIKKKKGCQQHKIETPEVRFANDKLLYCLI